MKYIYCRLYYIYESKEGSGGRVGAISAMSVLLMVYTFMAVVVCQIVTGANLMGMISEFKRPWHGFGIGAIYFGLFYVVSERYNYEAIETKKLIDKGLLPPPKISKYYGVYAASFIVLIATIVVLANTN